MLPKATSPWKFTIIAAAVLGFAVSAHAQESVGPQTSAPPPVAPAHQQAERALSGKKITVPAGTRLAVTL